MSKWLSMLKFSSSFLNEQVFTAGLHPRQLAASSHIRLVLFDDVDEVQLFIIDVERRHGSGLYSSPWLYNRTGCSSCYSLKFQFIRFQQQLAIVIEKGLINSAISFIIQI